MEYFSRMMWNHGLLILVLAAAAFWSVQAHKLTVAAAFTGGCLGIAIFAGAGFTGIAMTGGFFLAGTAATSWKAAVKEKLGIAEQNKSGRQAGQVVANAGVAAILGGLAWLYPAMAGLYRPMMAASLAAATSDTLSSELGNVYGRRFYNILTFRKDSRGENGVVSLEGTVCGVAGSAFIGLIYACGYGWNGTLAWITLSGVAGNVADSVLGATLERKHYLGNNAVNFLNTLIAALTLMALQTFFKP